MLAKNANSFIEFDISYFTKNRSECWLLKIPMPIQIKKKKGFLSTLIIWTWPGFLKDCTNWMKLDSCYFYELVDTLFYSLNNLSGFFYWQVQAVLAENDVCFVLTEKTAKYHLCIMHYADVVHQYWPACLPYYRKPTTTALTLFRVLQDQS